MIDLTLLISHRQASYILFPIKVNLKGVPNGMKGVFEGLLQRNGDSYKLLSSMAVMIETSAANHTTFRVLLNGI
jgi:hypothetical protein